MALQINYKTNSSKNISSNLVLFVDEKFNISGLKKNISSSELLYISDLLKNIKQKKIPELYLYMFWEIKINPQLKNSQNSKL